MTTNPIIDVLLAPDVTTEWVVPGFIPRGSLVLLVGDAGVGKSLLCYHIAMAVATGQPALGFPAMSPQRVVYFDQENARPDRDQYLRYVWHGLGCPSLDLIAANLWVVHFELGTRLWPERVRAEIKAHAADLVIIDTATPAFGIQDENSNGEATTAIGHLRELGRIRPCAFLVLKHARVDRDRDSQEPRYTIRGAKAWKGASDAVIFHLRAAGRPSGNLYTTILRPDKVRAFGLRGQVYVKPEIVPGPGIRLRTSITDLSGVINPTPRQPESKVRPQADRGHPTPSDTPSHRRLPDAPPDGPRITTHSDPADR